MAAATGQIVAERWKHTSLAWYVYQPTGAGDWFRWRLCTASQLSASFDGTYPCIAGCSRGPVYAGAQKTPAESDANNGFTTTATVYGTTAYSTNAYAHYRDFNVPEGMTDIRILVRGVASGDDSMRISFYATDTELSYEDFDCNVGGACLEETPWYSLPTGTTKVRLHKATDDAASIRFAGLDWINRGSVVDPDTAGSVMYCGEYVLGSSVIFNDLWNYAFFLAPSSHEMALYWSDDGGAYSTSNAIGGIGHKGIDTATIAWQTQSGTDAAAEWAPDQGDKLAADYLIMGITTAKAYRETARTNYRGTLTGKLSFDCSGVLIDYNVAIDQGTDMDVFNFYIMQLAFPVNAARYVHFDGEETVRALGTATLTSACKSPRVDIWGGNNGTHYSFEHLSADTNEYFQRVTSTGFPRLTYNTTYWKAYVNYYNNTTTPLDKANGTSLSTKWAIRLRDRGKGQIRRVRSL